MDIKKLEEQSKRVRNLGSLYRRDLKDFINVAFATHGNEFAYASKDNGSWEELCKSEDFCAPELLPGYMVVYDKHNFSHEIYPTRLWREKKGGLIFMEGYDWTDGEWTKDWSANDGIGDLESVAYFIDAVLQQEKDSTNDENIRRCDHCGKPMSAGYYLAGEFACSDECCLALYNGDRAQMEEDLSHAEEDDGDCYYTEWESIYIDE